MTRTSVKDAAVFLGMWLLLSCRQPGSPPTKAMSADQFQLVYIALLERGGELKNPLPDSAQHAKSDSILKAFGISAEEFRSTVAAYRSDPGKWQMFYDGVIKKLEQKQEQKSKKPEDGSD